MMNERYGDPRKILAAYRKEIKDWLIVKAGAAGGFRQFFNFLIKCRSLVSNRQTSPLIDSSDVTCMLLAKLPTYMQNRWNKNHDPEGSQVCLNKLLEDRSKFIYKSKPCYGCLSFISKVHNAKICKNRRSCKKCQEKHLASLHGLKIEKKTASRDKTNNENNIGTNNTLVQEGDESGEMLSCNSIYITSEVVSMCVLPV